MKLYLKMSALLMALMLIAIAVSGCGAPAEPTETQATVAATQAEDAATTEATDEEDISLTAIDALSDRLREARGDAADGSPVLMLSYDTQKIELSTTAYVYDNALAAMAFIASGRMSDAETILDAFVYATEHDRYQNGCIRSAYAAGDLVCYADGKEIAKLPGWWEDYWHEDPSQVGVSVGNISYVALALLQYDAASGSERYLATARTLMDRVIADFADDGDGFTAGYNGWPEEENKTTWLTYKSTEHNIDAYAAFRQLYAVTGEEAYQDAADSALRFIRSMAADGEGYFYVGTLADGVTPNTDVITLDTQVWAALALGDDFAPYSGALELVSEMRTAEGGYPFCRENKNGGYWCEGTAFTALMYRLRGGDEACEQAIEALRAVQLESGMFPAATVENLDTGIRLANGDAWEYSTDAHVAPTAWFVLAAHGFNPYTFD